MSDLMSKGELFNKLATVQTLGEAYGIIQGMETVDAVPVRHERWMPKFDGAFKGGAYWFECSGCNRTVPGGLQSGYYYCPNCGARMDGKGNGNETD